VTTVSEKVYHFHERRIDLFALFADRDFVEFSVKISSSSMGCGHKLLLCDFLKCVKMGSIIKFS